MNNSNQTRRPNGEYAPTSHLLRNSIIMLIVLAGGIYTYDKLTKVDGKELTANIEKGIEKTKEIIPVALAERSPDRLDSFKTKLLNEVTDKLKGCEGKGIVNDGRPTFDPPRDTNGYIIATCNNKIGGQVNEMCYSHGIYQMKTPTMSEWNKLLYGKPLTYLEAVELAFDEKRATEFVQKVIIEIPASGLRWSCVTRNSNDLGWYNAKISTIREIDNTK